MFNLLTFFNNLRYLGRYNIKTLQSNMMDPNAIIEQTLYEIPNTTLQRPIVYDIPKSIEFLLTTSHSLARYGDGEMRIIQGDNIPFQKYDKTLAERLTQILANTQANLAVAIPANWYYTQANISSLKLKFIKDHHRFVIPRIRLSASKIINFDKPYLETGVSFFRTHPQAQSFFDSLRKLWGGGQTTSCRM